MSLFSEGVCYLDLWRLEDAAEVFQKVSLVAENKSELSEYAVYSWCCLALINSHYLKTEVAEIFLEKVHKEMFLAKLSAWGKGYSLLFLGKTYTNLKKFEKSLSIFCQAIEYGQASHYPQVRAKALSGLAELYREQEDWETALSNHSHAIELLKKIGAKCDLAEVYYQLGLTYQKMGNDKQSYQQFQQSIHLFNEIRAPRQIEKVRQTIEKIQYPSPTQKHNVKTC